MKKLFSALSVASLLLLAGACSQYDDGELWSKVNSIDQRVTSLENALSQMNQSISALSVTVNALQKNLQVTSVVSLANGGSQITFSDGKTVVINTSSDGKDGKDGKDGLTPTIGTNGNWWIGDTDTGVKAAGTNGKDGKDGTNGTNGKDGKDGTNGTNGKDGLTPYIGTNGNWWIGGTDTGVKAGGNDSGEGLSPVSSVPIIGVEEDGGVYYWVQILNGTRTWLTDKEGNRIPVTGKDGKDGQTPIIRVDSAGYWIISYDGGITFQRIVDENNQIVKAGGSCECQQFFLDVYVSNGYLIMILIDGTVIRFTLSGGGSDAPKTPALPRDPNFTFPNPKFVTKYIPGRGYVLFIYVSGFRHPYTNEWMTMYGTRSNDRNTWVDIDDEGQIINIDEEESGNTPQWDVTFLVDNSGSMSEEADLIANGIISWAQKRAALKGYDFQFGCVGYSVDGKINGALDLTTVQRLSSYLNYDGRTGVERTTKFTETKMQTAAAKYSTSKDEECGGMALRFADANMSFRSDALRMYINFTDEPNYPNGKRDYSLTWFEDKSNWPSEKGIVHTIYSSTDNFTETLYQKENYKRLAKATGGQYIVTTPSMTGQSLETLDITESIDKSQIIDIDMNANKIDGLEHTIKLTFISADNSMVGQDSYTVRLTPSY